MIAGGRFHIRYVVPCKKNGTSPRHCETRAKQPQSSKVLQLKSLRQARYCRASAKLHKIPHIQPFDCQIDRSRRVTNSRPDTQSSSGDNSRRRRPIVIAGRLFPAVKTWQRPSKEPAGLSNVPAIASSQITSQLTVIEHSTLLKSTINVLPARRRTGRQRTFETMRNRNGAS